MDGIDDISMVSPKSSPLPLFPFSEDKVIWSRSGIITMDLRELPPIDPSKRELSKSFAESIGGVPSLMIFELG